ncbi:two-component sensor histidine kinase, partial [Pseudomonas aeruginosa]
MKTPLWFPQSFFARTLWLVLIVVLFSKALTLVYLLMNEDVIVDRQYSHGAALTIRAFWAADEESRAAIAKASGLRWVPSSADQPGEQHWPYTEIFQRQMQMELGPDTETRLRIHQPSQLWVRAPSLGEGWLAVPLYPHPLRGQRIWSVLGWFLGIGLLSTAAAWIFVRQLSQPLKRLVVAARQFGQGRSVRLPLGPETPSEMAEVYRAFNQMAEDIEQGGRERELMLAGVSHDLRTPLTRLRLSLELLPESEREMVEDMVRDIEDMDAILDQFLAFIRDGRDEPVEEGDLTDLVREVVAPFNQTREQVRMALQPVPAMPLRRVSMKRLLGNLIDNALNHGGGSVEVA